MVNMIRSHHAAASAMPMTFRPSPSALAALAEPSRRGNDDVLGAAVTQVQRMGVALAAIAKNGHFGFFDQVDVAIAVIINAHVSRPFS